MDCIIKVLVLHTKDGMLGGTLECSSNTVKYYSESHSQINCFKDKPHTLVDSTQITYNFHIQDYAPELKLQLTSSPQHESKQE